METEEPQAFLAEVLVKWINENHSSSDQFLSTEYDMTSLPSQAP